jgi:hypothetical protein
MSHPSKEHRAHPPFLVIPTFTFYYPTSEESTHNEFGFCADPTCPCREDDELKAELYAQVEEGIISFDDAERIRQGEVI